MEQSDPGSSGPQQFGRYILERKLALGGMAEIFLARQEGPEGFTRDLVIKRILAHLADDPQFVEMFLDEAKIVAQLSHPNIVPIFEFGRVEGSYFLAMELVRGPDLKRLLFASKKGSQALPYSHQAKIMAGCAEALEYAHRLCGPTGEPLGIVHRDISPSNVIVSYDGVPKLLDFGIAKAANRSHKTQTGVLKGKVPYMPPEQLMGREVDGRTDVYALGVVLFELATRQLPFIGDSDFHLMRLICDSPTPTAQQINGDVPEGLNAIIQKAMEKNPDDRYSAREMAGALEMFVLQSGGPVSSFDIAEYIRNLEGEVDEQLGLSSAPRSNPSLVCKTPSGQRIAAPPVDSGNFSDKTVAEIRPPAIQVEPEESRTQHGSDVWEVTTGSLELDDDADDDGIKPITVELTGSASGARIESTTIDAPLPEPTAPGAPAEEEGILVRDDEAEPEKPGFVTAPLIAGIVGIVAGIAMIIIAVIYYGTPRDKDGPTDLDLANARLAAADLITEKTDDPGAAAASPKSTAEPEPSTAEVGLAVGTVQPTGSEPTTADAGVPRQLAPDSELAVEREPDTDRRKKAAPPKRLSPKTKRASFIVLQSSPWTEIYRNGTKVGVTPLRLELPPGKHKLVLRNPHKGMEQVIVFKLKAGQTLTKMIKFESGTLVVMVKPWGEVWIDGKKIGVTPISPQSLMPGKHTVEVVQPKTGKRVKRSVTIQSGKPQRLTVDMSK